MQEPQCQLRCVGPHYLGRVQHVRPNDKSDVASVDVSDRVSFVKPLRVPIGEPIGVAESLSIAGTVRQQRQR